MAVSKSWRPKTHNQQVGYAGENFVAGEIHRRGGYAVTFSGNMKGIDLPASDSEHKRIISIQVKIRPLAPAKTSIKHGKKQAKPDEVTQFGSLWTSVQSSRLLRCTRLVDRKRHLQRTQEISDGARGHRAKTDESVHHAIPMKRIAEERPLGNSRNPADTTQLRPIDLELTVIPRACCERRQNISIAGEQFRLPRIENRSKQPGRPRTASSDRNRRI